MEDVNLMIEVTRRCNFSCGHCLRGEAQNKDLDIFKFRRYLIDEDIKYINHLTITGGEPLMAVKQLKEIAAELRWQNVGLGTVYIATNGSYFTPEAMEAVYEIYRLSEAISIQVSNSQWHKDERSRLEVPYISTNSELEEYMNEKLQDKFMEEFPDDMEDPNFFEYHKDVKYSDIFYMLNDEYFSVTPDTRSYKKILIQGRAEDIGNEQLELGKEDSDENFFYFSVAGEIVKQSDLSFKNIRKQRIKKIVL